MEPAQMSFPCAIPDPLREEHEELHARLREATQVAGPVGEAAKRLTRLIQPHLIREEEVAMRPLGLLKALAEGPVSPGMAGVLALTNALRSELPRMLAEHQQIVVALHALREVAREENRSDIQRLADDMLLHVRMEEEVLYPAALLVGEYLKLRLKTK
jgi:hypothetical protein